MNHCTRGFSALEMIVSLMISAMLLSNVLLIYNQISKASIAAQRVISLDEQITILHDRLSTDLQGLVPLWFNKKLYDQLKKENEQKSDLAKQVEQEPTTQESGKDNNFLYAQSNNNQFEFLTFVTNNALQVYSDNQLRTVRVIYFTQNNPEINTFKLMRKEDPTISSEINLEKLKKGQAFVIADFLTHCSIEYGFFKKSKDKDQPAQLQFVSEWGKEQTKKNDDKDEEKTPSLPEIIKLTLKAQFKPEQEVKTYELYCTMGTNASTPLKSFAQIRKEQEKAKTTEAKQAKDKNAKTAEPSQAKEATAENPDPKNMQAKNMAAFAAKHATGVPLVPQRIMS